MKQLDAGAMHKNEVFFLQASKVSEEGHIIASATTGTLSQPCQSSDNVHRIRDNINQKLAKIEEVVHKSRLNNARCALEMGNVR